MKTYIVDSFTNVPFKGNPAGVCILENLQLSSSTMQAIAQELNLSETAFIRHEEDLFQIRYFSPKMEIPLCGHATLASAKILFSMLDESRLVFKTIEDKILTVLLKNDSLIEMEFPAYPTLPAQAPKSLLQALKIGMAMNCVYNRETKILLIEVEHADTVRGLRPDFQALVKSHSDINGVLITSKYDRPDYDFCSRYFWPWSGTDEDPVTGGTHTFLTGYWSERLNKNVMKSFQASKRTGSMEVELTGNNTVLIRGEAVITFSGEMLNNFSR